MIYTTLNRVREHHPCADGWRKLLTHLNKTKADEEPLALATILQSNGLDDAIWCLRAVNGHEREMCLYAVWCARQVQHLTTDRRALAALDVAERHAHGQATAEELAAARDEAWAAARAAAYAASAAASAAAYAANAAAYAASAAAYASSAAASDEANAAAYASSAAAYAASAAASDEANAAAREAQIAEFVRVFCS